MVACVGDCDQQMSSFVQQRRKTAARVLLQCRFLSGTPGEQEPASGLGFKV